MKNLFIVVALLATSLFAKTSFAQNQLSPILTAYYGVKDALVNSNAADAAIKADALIKSIDQVDAKNLSSIQKLAYTAAKDKLKKSAKSIGSSSKVAAQRSTFSSLSNDMFAFAKAANISSAPVYQQYCPMKKSYWLSSESAIKNPYYGKAMLTCGNVSETIK